MAPLKSSQSDFRLINALVNQPKSLCNPVKVIAEFLNLPKVPIVVLMTPFHVIIQLNVDFLVVSPVLEFRTDIADLSDEEHSAALGLSSGMVPAVEPSVLKTDLDVVAKEVNPIVYPSLPDEPEIKSPGACRVGIRFPDGSRTKRTFLMSDSVKVFLIKTWSLIFKSLIDPSGLTSLCHRMSFADTRR